MNHAELLCQPKQTFRVSNEKVSGGIQAVPKLFNQTLLLGLIVNAASEVLKIPPSDIEAPGSVFAEGESGYVTGVGKLKGRLIILLDISKLLHRPEYKRLEEAAEPVATAR